MNPMLHSTIATLMIFFALYPGKVWGQSNPAARESLVVSGAHPEKIPGSFNFTEGPVADSSGNIYFSDYKNNRICMWSIGDSLTVIADNLPGPLGLDIGRDGRILVAATNGRAILSVDPVTRTVETLATAFNGKSLNSPNDLWRDKKGGIYFTDPRFVQLPNPPEQDVMGVYYLSPDHSHLTRVISDLGKPNGVAGTRDGKHLYVDDTAVEKTFVYTIGPDGMLSNRREFAPVGYDGITTDVLDNVYITGDGVLVYSSSGVLLERIPIPQKPSNVCFGGKDGKTLFITTIRGEVYRLPMRVKGSPR